MSVDRFKALNEAKGSPDTLGASLKLPEITSSPTSIGVDKKEESWEARNKKIDDRDRGFDKKYKEVRMSLRDSIEKTRKTVDKIDKSKSIVQESMDHAKKLGRQVEQVAE